MKEQKCSVDLDVFCPDESNMEIEGPLVQSFKKQMCLMRHQQELSDDCLGFFNEIDENLVTECHADIDNLCIDIQPGEHRVHKCLREHFSSLSPKCGAQIHYSAPLVDQNLRSSFDFDIDRVFQTLNSLFRVSEPLFGDKLPTDEESPASYSITPAAIDNFSVDERISNIIESSELSEKDDALAAENSDPASNTDVDIKNSSTEKSLNLVVVTGLSALGAATIFVLIGVILRGIKKRRDRHAEEEWTRTFAPALLA